MSDTAPDSLRRGGCLALLLVLAQLTPGLVTDGLALTNEEVLQRADEARGNTGGVTWRVDLEAETSKRTSQLGFEVQARAFDIRAEHVHPPREKGKLILMINGNMWFHKPGLQKPVPVSQRQKLLGNAAYGDIAATNYAKDYTIDSVSDEMLDGRTCYAFELKSGGGQTTYDRVRYWVDKERLIGVRAEYYTVSGKKFKTAVMEYGNTVERDGRPQPFISKMTILDEVTTENVTRLDFSQPHLEEIPDSVFNLNLLRR